jgi:hypothetical protein
MGSGARLGGLVFGLREAHGVGRAPLPLRRVFTFPPAGKEGTMVRVPRPKTSQEWGCRVLAHGLQRLQLLVGNRLSLVACRVRRRGEFWSVRIEGRLPPSTRCGDWETAGQRLVRGRGCARLPAHWLPGDPRFSQQLRLALTGAFGELAENSGLGWRVCRPPQPAGISRPKARVKQERSPGG